MCVFTLNHIHQSTLLDWNSIIYDPCFYIKLSSTFLSFEFSLIKLRSRGRIFGWSQRNTSIGSRLKTKTRSSPNIAPFSGAPHLFYWVVSPCHRAYKRLANRGLPVRLIVHRVRSPNGKPPLRHHAHPIASPLSSSTLSHWRPHQDSVSLL
jgi:hypothetical protein